MLEAIKEIHFGYFLMKGLEVDIKLLIVVRCDNVGAIFMAENSSSGIKTRHIDTKYHFVNEHVKDGSIKIIFVKSSIIDADIFKKKRDLNLEYRG
jgi:hypothetical protein